MSSVQPPGGSLTTKCQTSVPSYSSPSSTSPENNCPEKLPEKPSNQSSPATSSSSKNLKCQKSKTRESSKSPNSEETLILTKTEYDPNIEHHPSLLDNLLKSSTHSEINGFYFDQLQTEIQPWMRDQVVKWMLEVCEEQQVNLRTFPQAVDVLDRYLSVVNIDKNNLQLIGIASIYIASKIVECLPLNTDTCVMYTDYSVTKDQLIEMEFILLAHFKWDVYSTLSHDLVSPILFIFNLSAEIKNQAAGKIRCFFDCLLTESEFLIYSKRIQAIAVTSYVLTKFCFSSDAGLPDYAKKAPKFRIKNIISLIQLENDCEEEILNQAENCYSLLKDFLKGRWKGKPPSLQLTTPEQIESVHF